MAKKKSIGLPGGPNEYITDISEFLSIEGYKYYSDDVDNPINIIESGNITMEDVEFPVLGIDNLGNTQMMQPGMNYEFPGNMVFETPMAKSGGSVSWKWKGKSYSGKLIPSMETSKARYARTKNGKIKTLPKAQFGLFDKIGAFDKIKKNLAEGFNANLGYTGVTEDGMFDVNSVPSILRRLYNVGVKGEFEDEVAGAELKLAPNRNLEQNLFRLYLGQDQVGEYQMVESEYRPSKGDDKGDKYLSIPKKYQDDIYGGQYFPGVINLQSYEGLPNKEIVKALSPEYNKVIDQDMVIGDYTRGIGLNENDNIYLSAYDKFDLNPFASQVGDMSMGIGNPQDIYDRFNYVRVNTDTHPEFTFLKDPDGASSYTDALVREDKLEDYLELQRGKQYRYDRANLWENSSSYQEGGGVNEEGVKQYQFYKSYLNSQMYQDRLKNQFPDYTDKQIAEETKTRLENVMQAPVVFLPESSELSPSKQHNQGLAYPKFPLDPKYPQYAGKVLFRPEYSALTPENPLWTYNTTPIHEWDHIAIDVGNRMGDPTKDLLLSSTIDKDNYYTEPVEVQARLQELRYLLNDEGIYDTRKDQFTQEDLDNARSNWRIRNNARFKDIEENIKSDEAIIELMNSVAMVNDSEVDGSIQEAQWGGIIKQGMKKLPKYLKKWLGKTDDVVPGKNSEVNFIDNVYKQQLKDVHRIVNTELYNAKNPPTLQDLVSHYNKQSDDFTSVYRYGFDGDFTGSGAPWYSADLGDPLRYQQYKRGDGVFKADVPNDILRESYRGFVNNADAAAGKIPGLDPRFFHNALTNFKEFRFPEGLASAFQDQKFGKKTIEEYIDYLRSLKKQGGSIMAQDGLDLIGQDQKDFLKNWLTSPMGQKLLSNSFNQNEKLINDRTFKRNREIDEVDIESTDSKGKFRGTYTPGKHRILIDNDFANAEDQLFGMGLEDVLVHELSHSQDFGGKNSEFKKSTIPLADEKLINKLTKKNKKRVMDDPELSISSKRFNYLSQPTEVRARLNAIRYGYENDNLRKGLPSIFESEVTPEMQELMQSNTQYKQLQEIYTNDEINQLLNTISYQDSDFNQEADKFIYARDGKELPKAQRGLIKELIKSGAKYADNIIPTIRNFFKNADEFTSKIDWGKWNKEIPNNKALMEEYNSIEKLGKANGTWMKNPDGSMFRGTPEQWVQVRSSNYKKAFPNALLDDSGSPLINYHGSGSKFDIFDESKFYSGEYGKGVYTSTDKEAILRSYANPNKNRTKKIAGKSGTDEPTTNLYELYINANNPLTTDDIIDYRNFGKIMDNLPSLADWKASDLGKRLIKENQWLKTDDDIISFIKMNFPRNPVKESFIDQGGDFLRAIDSPLQEGVTPFSNQMKSSIGNNGMFDMTDPNIYKQNGGEKDLTQEDWDKLPIIQMEKDNTNVVIPTLPSRYQVIGKEIMESNEVPGITPDKTSGITPELLFSQAWVESKLDPSTKNKKGFMGLGQIGEGAIIDYKKANKVSELDPFNPQDNYNVQNWYMNRIYNSEWVDKPNQLDDVRLAKTLAGYSLGPKKAERWFTKFKNAGKDIYNSFDWLDDLPDETSKYIKMILRGENTEKRPRVQEFIKDAYTNDKYKSIKDLYFKRKGGENKIMKIYSDYINGKVVDKQSEKIYDKLNRIYLKDARKEGMSVPNYIMTYLADDS